MWESENQDESPLMTTDNFHGIDGLVALGGAGLVYFYFIAATWNSWMVAAACIVGFAGLYWLWDEHVNAGPRPKN